MNNYVFKQKRFTLKIKRGTLLNIYPSLKHTWAIVKFPYLIALF